MAEKKNLTLYQRLSKMLKGDGGKPVSQQQSQETIYNFNRDEILRTSDKNEFEQRKLQLQQSKYLLDKWQKIDNELYNKSIMYETTRTSAYFDFESMEFVPEISAALDLYSEESTQTSEKGHVLTIYSESTRIKSILANLFNNVLDINTNLQMWCRNMCKYGDNFVYLRIDEEKGIVGCNQLPNYEITRLEGRDFKGHRVGTTEELTLKPKQVVFKWEEQNMEFQTWEIAHFRILGDDRRLPYGTSMLDKIRRVHKQLILAEDAMLVYRTTRAPERRVFKVYVGNMEDGDIEAYVQKVANKFKRDQIVDQRNGNVDMRYNQMSVDQDYFIPVRDPNSPNPIETLPGASNLGEIADIEYIQKKMLAALRVPKAFLGFEEVVGDGKSLSLMDIRFSRTINKIQKALIQELNKIAIIHLYILGFEEELDNFTLGLTNPSQQADLLKIEQWKEKILLYKDAIGDGQTIAPVSHTFAKKYFLGMSDAEVKLDLQQQMVERSITEELNNTKNLDTNIFNNLKSLYQNEAAPQTPASGATENAEGFGGGGGGGSFSGSDLDFGGGGDEITPTADGGLEAGTNPEAPPTGAPNPSAPATGGQQEENEEPQPLSESMNNLFFEKDERKELIENLDRGRKRLNEIYQELDKLIND